MAATISAADAAAVHANKDIHMAEVATPRNRSADRMRCSLMTLLDDRRATLSATAAVFVTPHL
jgi:hypothetical protein